MFGWFQQGFLYTYEVFCKAIGLLTLTDIILQKDATWALMKVGGGRGWWEPLKC